MSQSTRVLVGCPNPSCQDYVPAARETPTSAEPIPCVLCGTLCPVTIVPPGGTP